MGNSYRKRLHTYHGPCNSRGLRARRCYRETHPAQESKSYVDYEEIDAVIKAWDRVARTDDTITKLNNFQSSYRTKGNLEIAVFRQTSGGAIAAAVSGGCDQVRVFLSLDEFIKLRWMIVQAKARLDEIK